MLAKTKSHAIRDPVHKWIKISDDEKNLIDHPYIQRLRHISQLTSVDHVFPGGVHNRFIHSLGAMHLAGKYIKNIFNNSKDLGHSDTNIKGYIQLARLVALLHDIAHGPFSHAYDNIVYNKIYGIEDGGHDLHRIRIVREAVGLADLIKKCGVDPEDIIKCWDESGRGIFFIIGLVVQGPLGADRLDFTLRDSYFCGTEHLGTISPQRIISNACILEEDGLYRLAYRSKIIWDVIQMLNSRFQMYCCVYLHKKVSASYYYIQKILEIACEKLDLVEKTKNIEKFLYINDYTIIGSLQDNELVKKWLNRDLPKISKELMIKGESNADTEDNTADDHISIRTKKISAIDPSDFDKNHIVFCGETIDTCSEILAKIGYEPKQESFYFLRYLADTN